MPWLFPMIDALPNWAIYMLLGAGLICVVTGAVFLGVQIVGSLRCLRDEWTARRYRVVRKEMARR
jgi:hypothetical protein